MATILVVDDERLICDLLRLVLGSHGHDVIVASTGEAGLELFAARKPRLTIIDICMPGIGGLEVLKQIHWKDPLAAVMILSGTATETLKRQAREWGAYEYLSKGVPLNDLMGAVNRGLVQPASPTPTPFPLGGRAQAGGPEPASILVVDDDPAIRNLLMDFLTARGYRVQTAQDGPAALALVAQHAPELILLDIYLPGMNGVGVLRELRARQYKGGVIVAGGDGSAMPSSGPRGSARGHYARGRTSPR